MLFLLSFWLRFLSFLKLLYYCSFFCRTLMNRLILICLYCGFFFHVVVICVILCVVAVRVFCVLFFVLFCLFSVCIVCVWAAQFFIVSVIFLASFVCLKKNFSTFNIHIAHITYEYNHMRTKFAVINI